ncbi:MAG: serine protease [Planctomycetaceae bacterium]|nr:MAG: serine protease [Planctomycetaceae bacterium]
MPSLTRVMIHVVIVGGWLALGNPTAEATAPQLASIQPRGASRGEEVTLTLSGARLDDIQEVLVYEPGLEVLEWQVVDQANVKVKMRIAADCPLGTKHLRVRTATGMSDMRTFRVGALPRVEEKEPNNEFHQPQPIPLNCTIEGRITNEDVDYFVVEARQGDRITAEVEGIRLGDALFDVYVAILNEQRFELSTSDDAALVYQDGIATVVAPQDGRYIIQIRESSYGNGSFYRCHVGTFPRPRGVIPAGAAPGQPQTFRFLGDVKGEFEQTLTLPDTAADLWWLEVQDDQGIAPSGVPVRVSALPNVIEQEPNNQTTEATRAAVPAALNGVLQQPQDRDLYNFTATKGQVFDITVYGRRLRSEIDAVLTVYNAQGRALAANDDTGGPDSYLRFTVPADGEFFIEIRDHLQRGGPDFTYRVEVTPIEPRLYATINEFVQYQEVRLAIPQGNRLPLLVTVNRRDLRGPIQFEGVNLPEGVTLEAPILPADQNVAQLQLIASPEAALHARFAQLLLRLADPEQPGLQVQGSTRQDCVMVRGRNQTPFFVEPLPSLAMSVIQKVPFRLELVPPKAPLVQSGMLKLKVLAHREEGFTAPIKVWLLQNPPGVSSSVETTIPEGQTEASIELNAAGNAQVREHVIAVRGEATVGNGSVTICSPFVPLQVVEPYLKLTFQQAAVEQGAESPLLVQVEMLKPLPSAARATLLGLPNKVTSDPLSFEGDVKELIFTVKAQADASPTTVKNLLCEVTFEVEGETVTHKLGSGQLRVDQPLPKKTATATPPTAQQPSAPATKPLSRLEQLRLEAKQRLEKTAGGNN